MDVLSFLRKSDARCILRKVRRWKYLQTRRAVLYSKKYSPISELSDVTEHYADVLYRSINTPVLICDRDHVISCAGISKKDFLDKRISADLEKVMEERKVFIGDKPDML